MKIDGPTPAGLFGRAKRLQKSVEVRGLNLEIAHHVVLRRRIRVDVLHIT